MKEIGNELGKTDLKIKEDKVKAKKGRSFYIALCICLMAIGIAVYSSYTSIKRIVSPDESTPFSVTNPSDILPKDQTSIEQNKDLRGIKKYKDITNDNLKTDTKSEETVAALEPDIIETNTETIGTIVLPAGNKMSKKYSGENPVYSKTFNDWRIHNGTDFNLAKGEKVVALTDGTVKDIYSDPIYGTTMVIDHNGEFTAYYSGLGKTTMVNIGEKVENGTEIGSIGSLPGEALDGDHLHLSIKKGDMYIDPLEILGKIE